MRILYLSEFVPRAQVWGDLRYYYLTKGLSRQHTLRLIVGATFVNWTQDDIDHAGQVFENVTILQVTRPKRSILTKLADCLASGISPRHANGLLDPNYLDAIAREIEVFKPDVVLAAYPSAVQHGYAIRDIPVVADLCDAWALNTGSDESRLRAWLRKRATHQHEAFVASYAQAVTVISERDASALNCHRETVTVVRNGVDLDYYHPVSEPYDPRTISFVGGMAYPPNVDGAVYFANEIWPLIRRAEPDARIYLVGRDPLPPVRELDGRDGIHVTGTVDDVRPYVWKSAVNIAPLRHASGLQNKVLQSLAMSVPVVLTPPANGGIQATEADGVIMASEPEAFANAVIELMRNPERRNSLGVLGRRHMEESYTWEGAIGDLEAVLTRAVTDPVCPCRR